MLKRHHPNRNSFRHNTDMDNIAVNKFERTSHIYQARTDWFRDHLLQHDNKVDFLKSMPRCKRHYKYHSVVYMSSEEIISDEKNFKFLRKMKQTSDMNCEYLLADCIEIYDVLPEGLHKTIVYSLIGLVIQLKYTDVARLRDLECEKIFRKIQVLLNDLSYTRRERAASIEFQFKDEVCTETKVKDSKLASKIKFLLARFEFIIATLGHFIHYNKIANTPQKKSYNRTLTSKSPMSVLTSVFTSMEMNSKKHLWDLSKRAVLRQDVKSRNSSRKESLEALSIGGERRPSGMNQDDEGDDLLKDCKLQQIKAYFKWKLEKWKDQDLEEIVLVCRICSKSMTAKIMKKHSTHCKQVAETEKILKNCSQKMADLIHAIKEEKHNVNVELIIEKKQLTSLKAQTSNIEAKPEKPILMSGSATLPRTKSHLDFFHHQEAPIETEKPAIKITTIREGFKALERLSTIEEKLEESPRGRSQTLLFPIPIDTQNLTVNDPFGDNQPEVPRPRLSRRNSTDIVTRSRSQTRTEADHEKGEEQSEQNQEKGAEGDLLEGTRERKNTMPRLNIITNSKATEILMGFNSNSAEASPEDAQIPLISRSKTSKGFSTAESPSLCVKRNKGRHANTLNWQTIEYSQTLEALRGKLETIKGLQTLLKGYELLMHYADAIDNFNEFTSEAKLVFEEGRAEVECFMEKVSDNQKFEDFAKEFLEIIADKLENIKSIDISKKELKLLEISLNETSESNKDDSAGTGNTHDARSSFDSIDIVSNSDLSPTLATRKPTSTSIGKSCSPEFEKRRTICFSDGSPIMKKTRKLRSKSVDKSMVNLRYELFEKNLQKVIKIIKREKTHSTNKVPTRSQFYKNSNAALMFEEDRNERLSEKNLEDSKSDASIHEKVGSQDSSVSGNNSSSSSSEDSKSSNKENKDAIFDTEQLEKSSFSDDETNLRKRAQKQEEGFSSIITINDFEFIKLISKGAYGRVWLVQRKITGDYYAMKIINFADRKNMNQIDSLKKEKKVLEVLKGDYVVKATFTFVHHNYLCIVMELMIGGDFGNILEKFGALEEDVAKFYIAELVLAVTNLHQLGIVHRDLKPDNILLNKDGHIKLTDFGLSEVGLQKQKRVNQVSKRSNFLKTMRNRLAEKKPLYAGALGITRNTSNQIPATILSDEFSTIPEVDEEAAEAGVSNKGNRIIGTPDYMAPEVINGTCYDDPCIDFWSVGVILFEFIVGIPPFNDANLDTVFNNVVKRKIPWDELSIGYDEGCVTPEAKDLIDRLLTLDRKERLGAKGVDEIKHHPFFKDINWDNILKSKAPIIPEIESATDVGNFKKESKKFLECELENPFHDKSTSAVPVSINKETFEFARVDILHEENQKVVKEATNTISQEELEKMRKTRLVNRKWSVFD